MFLAPANPRYLTALFASTLLGIFSHLDIAQAMVGGARPAPANLTRKVVMFTGSGGTFCTATVIGRLYLLTAAHCIDPNSRYKLIQFRSDGQPVLEEIVSATRHPQFDMQGFLKHRATADVGVLKLLRPLPGTYDDTPLVSDERKIEAGQHFTVAGFGVSIRGDGRTGGTLRAASLVVTGQPSTLQVRLVDPISNNATSGMGACTGDSGAPTFDAGGTVVGIVSWSTAPKNEGGCGGLTGITPLIRYREWVAKIIAEP